MEVHKRHVLALAVLLAAGDVGLARAQEGGSADDDTVGDDARVDERTTSEDGSGDCDCDDDGEDEDEDEDDALSYGQAGVWELGGALGFYWTEDVFTLNVNPQAGLFVIDYLELSLILGVQHESIRDPDGSRHDATTFSVVLEPSYHLPVIEDDLYVFAGLGVGVAYDGVAAGFDLAPRVGTNIGFGRTRMLTPSLRVPIIMGREVDENGDGEFSTSVSVGFDVGYTTLF